MKVNRVTVIGIVLLFITFMVIFLVLPRYLIVKHYNMVNVYADGEIVQPIFNPSKAEYFIPANTTKITISFILSEREKIDTIFICGRSWKRDIPILHVEKETNRLYVTFIRGYNLPSQCEDIHFKLDGTLYVINTIK